MSPAFAQDVASYLKNFDAKIYSLKSKGVKDFVVDIESSKLTRQMNDLQQFGKVEELIFRAYWTAEPERLAIEVIGLPDGFKEIKEELKLSILPMMDNLIPQTMPQRFAGHKFQNGANSREIIARDTSGMAQIPSYLIKFDEQDKVIEVIANKAVGTLEVRPLYEKSPFADGKWVLKQQTNHSTENGQSLVVTKSLDYEKIQGMGVLSEVQINSEYKLIQGKSTKFSESITFKNYRINEGEGLKYFLGESKILPASAPAR